MGLLGAFFLCAAGALVWKLAVHNAVDVAASTVPGAELPLRERGDPSIDAVKEESLGREGTEVLAHRCNELPTMPLVLKLNEKVAVQQMERHSKACREGSHSDCDDASSICYALQREMAPPPRSAQSVAGTGMSLRDIWLQNCAPSPDPLAKWMRTESFPFDAIACKNGSTGHCLRARDSGSISLGCLRGCIDCCRAGAPDPQRGESFPHARGRQKFLEGCLKNNTQCIWPGSETLGEAAKEAPLVERYDAKLATTARIERRCFDGDEQACSRIMDWFQKKEPKSFQERAFRAATMMCKLEPLSCFHLAGFYSQGVGTPKDEPAAARVMGEVLSAYRSRGEEGSCPHRDEIRCLPWSLNDKLINLYTAMFSPRVQASACISGDMSACHRVLLAIRGNGGRDPELLKNAKRAHEIITAACERGDKIACPHQPSDACRAGDQEACLKDAMLIAEDSCPFGDISACIPTGIAH